PADLDAEVRPPLLDAVGGGEEAGGDAREVDASYEPSIRSGCRCVVARQRLEPETRRKVRKRIEDVKRRRTRHGVWQSFNAHCAHRCTRMAPSPRPPAAKDWRVRHGDPTESIVSQLLAEADGDESKVRTGAAATCIETKASAIC